jgi:hypothetical protein
VDLGQGIEVDPVSLDRRGAAGRRGGRGVVCGALGRGPSGVECGSRRVGGCLGISGSDEPRRRCPVESRMKSPPNAKGTILRDDRMDEPSGRTRKQLEQRATELAVIRGVDDGSFQPEDLAEAKRELDGERAPTTSAADEEASVGLTRDPAEPRSIPGRQVPDLPANDEQEAAERLALEGVDAAERERMLAARRKKN